MENINAGMSDSLRCIRGVTAVSAVSGDLYVCPFLFDFLTVREVGRAACVCRAWREAAEDDELWREQYARTQVGETAMEDWARALAARPFGEDAVGWEVKVCNEEDNTWHQGLVVEYAHSSYRVEYPDGSSRWESEQRTQGPWHRRGNSRLFFIGRLHDSIAGGNNHITSNNSSSSSCGKTPARPSMSSVSGGMWGQLRHGRWKEELKANACHVPAVELVRLMDHTDEVLDLKFSPDGTRLATCSRDMSILIYSVEEQEPKQEGDDGDKVFVEGAAGGGVRGVGAGGGVEAKFGEERWERLRSSRQRLGQGRLSVRLIHRLRRSATASVCRIFWSPCSRFILSCLEEPHGDPFEPSSSELWDATLGSWLSRCRSQPFDVHAAWLPDGHHFVAGLEIHRDVSDVNASFSQTLAIRRRPNLAPIITCGDAVEARTFDPGDRPRGRPERVDSSCMASSPKPSGKAVPGAGRTAEEVGGVMWVDPAVEDDRASIGGDGMAIAAGAGEEEEGSGGKSDDAAIPFTFGEAAATSASERRGITGRHFGDGGVQPQLQQQQQQLHAMDIDDSNGHVDHEDWWCSSDSKQEHDGGGWGGLGSAPDDDWMPNAGESHNDAGLSAGASSGLSAGASSGLSAGASAGSSAGASAGLGVGASAGSGAGASASGVAAALDGELFNFGDAIPPLMVVGIDEDGEEIHGVDGGVQWVVEGSQTIHTADEADMPLVGEIRLNLGRNFGHFFQMSSSGQWACIATGKTPLMCHRIAFIPLHGPRLPPPPNTPASNSNSNSNSNSGGEDDVFVFLEGRSKNAFAGGSAGSSSADSDMEMEMEMETVECGGAILSLSISRDDRFAMANVRPFTDGALERLQNTAEALHVAPDISNEVELQVWDVETKKLLFKLGGHHAFTTKECPFLIFAEQSAADPFGDYVCSGSEEHQVYVWHLRHRLLLQCMKGHDNVVNSVSWNPKIPGVLASCSDDGTAIIWGPKVR